MPTTWEDALNKYSYPVNLANFADARLYPGWFEYDIRIGGLDETAAFEGRFRELAPNHIEAWYEVVYWKMASQRGRADYRTRTVINRINALGVTANELWVLCREFVESQDMDRGRFRRFREKLFSSTVVATAATFSAFLDTDRFPMVDTQIANWCRENRSQHEYTQVGVVLEEPPEFTQNMTVIYERHWGFIQSWIYWCRHTRDILNKHPQSTKRDWTARQVEMAVFTAQSRCLTLNPLG